MVRNYGQQRTYSEFLGDRIAELRANGVQISVDGQRIVEGSGISVDKIPPEQLVEALAAWLGETRLKVQEALAAVSSRRPGTRTKTHRTALAEAIHLLPADNPIRAMLGALPEDKSAREVATLRVFYELLTSGSLTQGIEVPAAEVASQFGISVERANRVLQALNGAGLLKKNPSRACTVPGSPPSNPRTLDSVIGRLEELRQAKQERDSALYRASRKTPANPTGQAPRGGKKPRRPQRRP